MIHIGRCGSSVVSGLLKQHPKIHWSSELYTPVLRNWKTDGGDTPPGNKLPGDAVGMVRRDMERALHRYYGFEVKPFHFQHIGYSAETFIDQLEAMGFTHYILLDRNNKLRSITSNIVARQNGGKYHNKDGFPAKLTRISIDPDNLLVDMSRKPLIRHLEDYDREVQWFEELLQHKKSLRLRYEDDIEREPKHAYRRICEFLDLETTPASVKLSRVNPFPLSDIIENFADVRSSLSGTRYEWMLDD